MILRLALLCCMLAASAEAVDDPPLGTDGQPITMHNDPMLAYNGSLHFKVLKRTFILPSNYAKLGFAATSIDKVLVSHAHDGRHTIQVLSPVGNTQTLKATAYTLETNDTLVMDITGPTATENAQIIVTREPRPGASKFVAAHEHIDQDYDAKLKAFCSAGPAKFPPGKFKALCPAASAIAKSPMPAGPTLDDWLLVQARAQGVSDWVWIMRISGPGTFQPADKAGVKLLWPSGPLPVIAPPQPVQGKPPIAPADEPLSLWARYSNGAAHITRVTIKHTGSPDKIADVSKTCGAVSFCHMNDTYNKTTHQWGMSPDCSRVQYTCPAASGQGGKLYSWQP